MIRELLRLTNGPILLAVILIPAEKFFAGDIAYYFLTSLLPNRVLAIPLGSLAAALVRFTPPWSLALPVWLRVAQSRGRRNWFLLGTLLEPPVFLAVALSFDPPQPA